VMIVWRIVQSVTAKVAAFVILTISHIKKIVLAHVLSKLVCSDCPENCKTCNRKACFACDSGDLLYGGGCVDSCPERTFSTASTCFGKRGSRI